MTAAHGYHTYLDLVQAYDLTDLRQIPERPKTKTYTDGTIARWLQDNKYSLMLYLLEIANVDKLASESQFNTTMFVCPDERMIELYGSDFFANLDRNTARRIVNVHSLPRIVRTPSLLSRRVAVLDTKDPQSTLTFTNNRGNITVMSSRDKTWCHLQREVILQNGVVMVMDGFFIPENFSF